MPAMQFTCPHCKQLLKLASAPAAGTAAIKCPRCGKTTQVAGQASAPKSTSALRAGGPPATVARPKAATPPRKTVAKTAPAPKKSGGGLKILLGCLALLFVLTVLAVGGVSIAGYLYYAKARDEVKDSFAQATNNIDSPTHRDEHPKDKQVPPKDPPPNSDKTPDPKPVLKPEPNLGPEPEPTPVPTPARPKGTAGKDDFEPFPMTAPNSGQLMYNLVDLTGPGTYKKISGPEGMPITKEGMLRLAANPGDGSVHKLVFSVDVDGAVETFRFNVKAGGWPGRAMPGARRPLAQPIQPPGTFRRLPTEAITNAIEVSEDGNFLFAAHQEANKVSVWDLRRVKQVKSVEAPQPRVLLFRAGKLFVGSHSEPVVRVFAQAEDWKLGDELKVGATAIISMTAPRGTAFQNQIIVNTKLEKDGPPQYSQYALDVGKDKFQPITAGTAATVDAVGRHMLMGKMGADYVEAITGGRLDLGECGSDHLFPAARPGYWFERDGLWSGMPPQLVAQEKDTVAVADLKRDLVYFVGVKAVKGRLLRTGAPEVGSQPVTFPTSFSGLKDDGFFGDFPQHRYRQHIAVTSGDKLYLYLLSAQSREIYHTRLPAFSDKPTAPDSSTPQESDGIVARGVEGKELSHQLANDGGKRSFALLSGPDGLKLAPSGAITWTPKKEQIGAHEIKARITVGDKTSIERIKLEVLDKDLVASSGGDPNKAGAFSQVERSQGPHRVLWSLDRKNMLLLQGRQLDILSADGQRVERSMLLDRYCQVLAERPEYYVGMSPLELRLIDKKTGKTLKSISLKKYRQLHDFAIHPTKKVSYVALENTVEAITKNRCDWQRVVQVDEDSGTITELDGVYGRFLAVDPQGMFLYTGFKDVYRNGLTFHINPGGRVVTFPEFGNIDILLRYAIDGDKIDLDESLRDAGGNGNGLALSPDGNQIAYLSNGGYPSLSRNVVGLQMSNFKEGSVTYATKGVASCMSLLYHPVLPLVACPSKKGAVFFDSKTGKESPNRLKLTAQGLGNAKVESIIFSADGKHLVFGLLEPGRAAYFRSVALNLSAEEAALAKAGAILMPPPNQPADNPARDLLIGTWENTKKKKSTLTFAKDGTLTVLIAGEAEQHGKYRFLDDQRIQCEFEIEKQKLVMKIKIAVTKDELITRDEENKEDKFRRVTEMPAKPPDKPNPPAPSAGTDLKARLTLKEHTQGVDFLAFSRDGNTLASYSDRAEPDRDLVILWDVTSGKKIKGLKSYAGMYGTGLRSLSLASGGFVCLCPSGADLLLVDASNDKIKKKYQGAGAELAAGVTSLDGKMLAGAAEKKVLLWAPDAEDKPIQLGTHDADVKRVCFSSHGKLLMSVSQDHVVKIWDVATRKELQKFQGQGAGVDTRGPALSGDGSTVAAPVDKGRALKLWDTMTGEEKAHIKATTFIRAIALSPHGEWLATSEEGELLDKTYPIALRDARTGQIKANLLGHTGKVNCLAFSADGLEFASGSQDMSVKLWNLPAEVK